MDQSAASHDDPRLCRRSGRLCLMLDNPPADLGQDSVLYADLSHVDGLSPTGRSLKQPIARAVGLFRRDKNQPLPSIIDATAGLGEDAWLLASLGCRVTAVEREPIVAALLGDALQRAAEQQPEVAGRIELHVADAVELLSQHRADVVYLDPMFPPRKNITERKAMRLLRMIVGDNADAAALFQAALNAARKRVVVKRPLHAPRLTEVKPTSVHKGKTLRYDVYAVANI